MATRADPRRPVVIDGLCIGCGSCEWHCPVEGRAAIRVEYSPLAGQMLRDGSAGRGAPGREHNRAGQESQPVAAVEADQAPTPTTAVLAAARTITAPSDPAATAQEQRPSAAVASAEGESAPAADQAAATSGAAVLVAYFTRTGNTRLIAEQIYARVGGDSFEIATVEPYPSDYRECLQRARKELAASDKPKLKAELENSAPYSVVFLGYPNWYSSLPRAMVTFLSGFDTSGKTIAPFCTHGGGGLGRTIAAIKELCPEAKVVEALAIRDLEVRQAQNEVARWLDAVG